MDKFDIVASMVKGLYLVSAIGLFMYVMAGNAPQVAATQESRPEYTDILARDMTLHDWYIGQAMAGAAATCMYSNFYICARDLADKAMVDRAQRKR